MSIVRYRNPKTKSIYLYESTQKWDPVKKQARPVRKYLGKEDPVTGELIPSTGKRGRKPKEKAAGEGTETDASTGQISEPAKDFRALYEESQRKLEAITETKDADIRQLREELHALKQQDKKTQDKLKVLKRQLSSIVAQME